MSIADKITRLQAAKEDIAEAIVAKGGAVASGDGFEEFSTDINEIPEGLQVEENYTVSDGKLTSASVEIEGEVVAHIPDGVTEIGNDVFMSNSVITSVTIPNSVLNVEDGYSTWQQVGTFIHCKNLKNVTLSNNLTKIADYMFDDCTALSSIIIPDSVTSIGTSAFAQCPLNSVVLSNNVTNIGRFAFSNCTSLSTVIISDSLTTFGDVAFQQCTALTDIYYTGTQEQWESIEGISNAGIPETCTIHYEYVPE